MILKEIFAFTRVTNIFSKAIYFIRRPSSKSESLSGDSSPMLGPELKQKFFFFYKVESILDTIERDIQKPVDILKC